MCCLTAPSSRFSSSTNFLACCCAAAAALDGTFLSGSPSPFSSPSSVESAELTAVAAAASSSCISSSVCSWLLICSSVPSSCSSESRPACNTRPSPSSTRYLVLGSQRATWCVTRLRVRPAQSSPFRHFSKMCRFLCVSLVLLLLFLFWLLVRV